MGKRRRWSRAAGDATASRSSSKSGEWSPADEAAALVTRERHHHALAGRERLVGAPFGVALMLTVVAMSVWVPDPRTLQAGPALAFLAAFVLAARVEFQTGAGYAVPTQLVVVPMLFALPAAAVPVVIGVGYVITRALETPRPPLSLERLVGEFANAWYVVAPALVIVLAHAQTPALEHWPVYVAALAAQLALDAATACLRAGIAFGTPPAALLRELRFAQRLDLALAPLGLLAAIVSVEQPYAWLLVLPLIALIATFGRERTAMVDNQLELARAYRGTALLLGEVVEGDDEYTGRHSRGVGMLALEVADALGVDDRMRRDIEFGALLHDVGKVAIPDAIINKPGPLTPEEWEVMRTHTVEGERMLQRVGGVLEHVGVIVRASHERWDGAGYPDGLAGEAIPLAARIVSCCDAFSAMTTDRSYRKARPLADAIEELHACSGTQFDPDVVTALVGVVERRAAGVPRADRPQVSAQQTLDRLAAEVGRTVPVGPRARRSRAAHAPFRALIDTLEDGVILHDADGIVQACNRAAERFLGVDGALLDLDEVPAADQPRLVDEEGLPLGDAPFPWTQALATRHVSGPLILGVAQPGLPTTWLSVSSRPLRRRGRARPYAVVSTFIDVTERRLLQEELRGLVDRDGTTGLPSRRRFLEDVERQIERSRRYAEQATLLVLEVEGLPAINTAHGSATEDAVLRTVAGALEARVRAGDVIGRLGGPRFAVLLAHAGVADAERIAAELRTTLAAAVVPVDGGQIGISTCVGVAPIDAATAGTDQVLVAADVAIGRARV